MENELKDRYLAVKTSYWWKVSINGVIAEEGRFYTKDAAEGFIKVLMGEFIAGTKHKTKGSNATC